MATPEASRTLSLTTSLLALSPVLAVSPALAQSLPSGGTVTAGNATIETSGSSLIVSQSSQNAIIAWESFSVGSGATAHFENGAGATLNRVRGRLPSTIDGLLTASGSVYLVNPAGVTVGSGGVVRTGGSFVASTLDVTDEDFLDGGALTLTGGSAAAVINLGSIASAGGDVVLTARRVENAGSIEAPAGSAGLLAGYEVELRDTSLADGKLAVRVGGSDTEVVNRGVLRAADAELRANGGHVQALAGNTEAIIKATGVEKSGGRIFLTAGEGGTVEATQRMQARRAATPEAQPAVAALPEEGSLPAAGPDFAGGEVHVSGGTVTLAGAIDATGAGDAGGTITAVGKDRLDVLSTAVLDASGSDGGTVLLGGDYQGGQDASSRYLDRAIGTAAATAVASGALIRADGTKGAGGNVVIWSDGTTTFDGEVSAVGVTAGGDAEVSGKALLGFTGTVDLRATAGEAGTLLLDPYNVTISTEADGSTTGNDSVINVSTLTNALQAASVVVGTGTGGAQDGNITVDAEIAWGAGTRLTLDAANNITVNAPIRMEGTFASLVLDASNGELTINAPIVQESSNQLVSLLASSHTLYTNPFLNLHFGEEGAIEFGRADQGGRLSINGTEYTLVYSMEQLDAIDGVDGVTGANVATYGPGLGGAYALARDLDAAGTTYTRALIGTNATEDAGSRFAGTLEGLGHVITNLTIDAPSLDYVGLIGYASDLTVRNIGLEGGSVSGNQYVAGIVGRINAGTIQQTYSTLDVTANEIAGGLVGIVGHVDADADPTAYASIVASHATGDVTGSRTLGGLLGGAILQSIIADSYATGDVRGTDYVGGLAGAGSLISHSYATGDVQATGAQVGGLAGLAKQITHSYATGDVSGAGFVGGLVGFVDLGGVEDSYATGKVTGKGDGTGGLVGATLLGPISRSYATGDVSGRGVGTGGLVGESNGGSVSQSYATGDVVGDGDMTGGLVGAMLGGGISQSYATGSVHGGGSGTGGLAGGASSVSQSYATGAVYGDDTVGGLVGALGGGGSISESYATGAVHGSSTVGGLAGGVLAGTVTDSYWDTYTTGQPGAFGVFLSGSADSVSAITSDPSQSGAANYAYKQGAYSGFTFTATPGAGDWYMIEGETRPFGAWEYSTDIVNAHQLQLMAMDLGADYTLLADIDLGAALAGVDYGTGGAADIRRPGMWGGRGFMPVGGSVSLGVPFSGTFDGQGHVVSGLTIDRSTDDFVGLFGLAVDAAIRDVGLVDARIRGRFGSGALVGRMDRTTVTRSYATGMVTGTEMVGGLVGHADFFSTITRSYFSGSVAGGEFVGGLAGMVGESSQVSQSYTTGAVSGVNRVGGLVGLLGSSFTPPEVRQSYSTSAVKGTSFVGGLVGEVSIGVIGEAYASGAVVGDDYVGGLIGSLSGFVTDSYWDVETTGQSEGAVVGSGSFSATGLTTHDLQAALPTDFDASVWGIVPSVSNPYLRWRFPNGPTVISGTAHDIAGGVGSLEVGVAVNGTLAGSIYTGTNGYYNVMLDPVEAGSAVVTWLTGTRHGMGTTTSRANAVAELASSVPAFSQGHVIGLDLYSGTVSLNTSIGRQSEVNGLMRRALDGSDGPLADRLADPGVLLFSACAGCPIGYADGAALHISSSASSYVVDANIGDVADGAPAHVAILAEGDLTLGAGTTITAAGAGDAIVLSAGGLFSNDAGSGALALTNANGRWLVYLADPDAGHVYAGLDSANTAVWGTAALDPVAAPGNRYVFAYRPTVDIVLSDRTKTYGDELVLGSVEGTDFTLSGAREGVEGAYEADTAASIFGGTMTLHSSGAAANADVIAGGYAITADTSGLTLNGYDLGSVINGTLTVDPRSISLGAAGTVEASRVYDGTTDIEVTSHGVLSDIVAGDDIGVRLAAAYQDKNVGRDKTVTGTYTLTGADAGNYVLDSSVFAATADITPAPLSVIARAAHKVYGESDPDFAYEVGGFVLGEDDSLLTGSLSRVEGENVGDYAITVGSLSAGGNYEIVYTGADLTITPRTITITADDQSRALGQADPRLTWSITGGSLASFDTIDTVFSGDLIRDPGEGVGEYAIRQGSLAANANYDLTFIGGTLHITPVAVTEPVVLERHAVSDDVFAIVQSEGGTDLTVCRSGVLGPDCAPFVSPDNRNLGPYIGWTGQSAR